MTKSRTTKMVPNNKPNVELTEAEWEIMKVVWEKEPCAAGTVQEALIDRKDWAYTTVKLTMNRMVKKDKPSSLLRVRWSGRRFPR